MLNFSIAEARSDLARVIALATTEPVEITRHGKPVAVLVEPGVYERLVDAFEEFEDSQAVDAAKASGLKAVPWDEVKRELGLA